ncbi:hypothetical protein NOR51B_840 [Luminiphilus syltensis NOR5-1B]|uniref:Uncharacterized protein n=1 Tax=Luminiphilus syltensis NOR5-1B TaxID=565045 RepID=B8KVM3_9GAMM|nr:hypothetical protein NOR51B_840 [Luminiphilus syltensis NOR5-1B]
MTPETARSGLNPDEPNGSEEAGLRVSMPVRSLRDRLRRKSGVA